jgi:solute carrier family 39 (zinc transporter), member 7
VPYQECPLVQALNEHKVATNPATSSLTSQIFSFLFPGSPAVNALLATLYISGPPNFLLALCPPNIDPSSLSVMVAFAVGGLLGDTLFHLLPEIFLGEDEQDKVKFVMVEPNKNLLLGVAIMVGFVTFVAMDKGLRIATGGEGGHDQSHGHSHEKTEVTAKASGADING